MPDFGIGEALAALFASGIGEAGLVAGDAALGTAAAAGAEALGGGALGAGLAGLGLGADALGGLGLGAAGALDALGTAGGAAATAAAPAAGAAGGVASAVGGLPGLTAAAGGLPVDLTAATLGATGVPEGAAGLGAVAGGAGQAAVPFSLGGPGGLSALGGAGGFDFAGALPGATQASADIGGTALPGVANPEVAGQAAAPGSLSSIEAANPVLETPGFAPSSFAGADGSTGLFGSLKGGLNSVVDTLGLNDPSTRALMSAGGLGLQALKSSGMPPGGQQLQTLANQFSTQGATLTTDALAGKLPPGAQAQLSQASEAAKAKVRSEYARMGLSGSTMETQAMAQADQQMAAQGYQMMQQLLSTGLSEEQAAATMMQHLMTAQTSQQTALTSALGRFAGGLGGSTGTTKDTTP